MDQRRYMLFVILTMIFFLVWSRVAPTLFPGVFPDPKQQKAAPQQVDQPEVEENVDPAVDGSDGSPTEDAVAPDQPETVVELEEFQNKQVVLGEEGFKAGYLLTVQLNSKGAAVDWAVLNDPRYLTLDRKEQIKVVGNPIEIKGERTPATFEMSVPQIDSQLEKFGASLAEVDWEIVSQDSESVTFRYPSPDGTLEVLKTYHLKKGNVEERDSSPNGYLLEMDIVLRNTSDATIETAYTLQGPVGMPLENAENTRSFREIDIGTIEDDRYPTDVTSIHMTAAELVKQVEKAKGGGSKVDAWREPIVYAGVDVQFFTSLILPEREDAKGDIKQVFDVVSPQLLVKDEKEERSDFSIVLNSVKETVEPGSKVEHSFQAFFGPKRTELLEPLNADGVVRLGFFGAIAKVMLGVLDFFHSVIGLPYAFAIILLTVVVRGLMFPISKKQAIESEKMKILSPKLKEIQEKNKDNPEEFAKAYRAFQKKYNYHPMVGCLPALLQLPIFWGLYTSLYQAVDLRLAEFLWIENLAAPDALFPLGFTVPWFGYTEFNLLPILTVVLFITQQKMFTPPPTSEEQAMTYKMMNVMMIAIGFAFYRVPAGLCLYFISSSLWGICERTLLKSHVNSDGTVEAYEAKVKAKAEAEPKTKKEPGFFDKLLDAADQAKKQSANAPGSGGGGERKYSKQKKRK